MNSILSQGFHVVEGARARSEMDREPSLDFFFGLYDTEVDT
jgi:hypothetical protein